MFNKYWIMNAVVAIILAAGSQAPAAEKILPMNARSEILLPPDSDGLAWRYDMKMVDWTSGGSGFVYDLFTQEQIDRRADELKAAGMNTVIISGFHMHHCFLDEWPKVTRNVAMVTAAAHKHGMKVIFHHDVPVIIYAGKGLNVLLQHLDWLQRDIEYDRPTLRSFCFINPGFRASYFDRMETFARDTGIDGVMLDEVSFTEKEFCGCEHCRRAFTEQTGLVLPRDYASKTFYNKQDPIWIAWLEWRKHAVGDWWVAMRKRFNTVNRDFCVMKYTTHGGFSSGWAPLNLGADIVEDARGCDFLGTEIMPRNTFDVWRAVYAYRKAKAALGDHYGMPIWGLVYHSDEPNFAYVGWAMNHMNRQTSWISMIEGENMGRYMDWPMRMQSRFAKPMSDAAVLFSFQARDFGAIYSQASDAFGISQCLTDAHIQHDFILDNDLGDLEKLSAYKLLILPSAGNISEQQAESMRKFVRSGGRILASAHTSLFDEYGFERKNFALADVFGVDYVAPSLKAPQTVRMRADGRTIVTPSSPLRVKAHEGAWTMADIMDAKGKAIFPAIVSNKFGQGQSIYVAFQPGAPNCESEQQPGVVRDYEKNRELADLLLALVRQVAGVPFDVEAVAVPEGVALSVCRQGVADKSAILLHLLNMTGANLKKGETIQAKPDWAKRGGPFPAIGQDMVIDVRCKGKVARAYIVSPDYEKERPVEAKAGDGDIVRVTVRKDDLQAYSIVYLELADAGNRN